MNEPAYMTEVRKLEGYKEYLELEDSMLAIMQDLSQAAVMWQNPDKIKKDIHYYLHNCRHRMTKHKRQLALFSNRLNKLLTNFKNKFEMNLQNGVYSYVPKNKTVAFEADHEELILMIKDVDRNIEWFKDEISGVDQQINGLTYYEKLNKMLA